jgi:hypothetical protein
VCWALCAREVVVLPGWVMCLDTGGLSTGLLGTDHQFTVHALSQIQTPTLLDPGADVIFGCWCISTYSCVSFSFFQNSISASLKT